MLHPFEPALSYMYRILFYVIWTYDLPGKSNGSSPGLDLEGHLPCSYKRCFDRLAGAKPTTPQPSQTGLFLYVSSRVAFYQSSIFHRSPFVGAHLADSHYAGG